MQKKNIVIIEDNQQVVALFEKIAATRDDINLITLNPVHPEQLSAQTARMRLDTILLENPVSTVLLGNRLGSELNGQSLIPTIKKRNIPFFSYSSFDGVHDEYKEMGAVGRVYKVPASETTRDFFQSEANKLFEW